MNFKIQFKNDKKSQDFIEKISCSGMINIFFGESIVRVKEVPFEDKNLLWWYLLRNDYSLKNFK
jgi:hypothetical protein